jgi:hypothetical protein
MSQLIIAGNHEQALELAKRQGCKSFKYIFSMRDLRGEPRGQRIWLAGTFYCRKDWIEMRDFCELQDHKLLAEVSS